ncbi:MAG: peptide ABC transporter substrate-binding protein [Chloroflexaceae bacterium]|nr:peptide ABC transporter substrate-binding protein [Chloroflexaceae bacterium]
MKMKWGTSGFSLSRWLTMTLLVVWALWLAACEVEGGVPPPTTPGTLPQASTEEPLTPSPPPAAPEATHQPRDTGFRVGLLDEPGDLLPYHDDAADQRLTAPVSELLFPSPLLAFNYTYTSTGVLERIPSFQNGDIEVRQVEVYLDPSGDIIRPVAGAITQTRKITLETGIRLTQEIVFTSGLTSTATAGQPSATSVTTPTSTESLTRTPQFIITQGITKAQQVVVTYRWNPALRWSDGVTVTASDSVFAYELARQSQLGTEASNRLDILERYETVDDHTTRAFLSLDFLDQTPVITPTPGGDLTNLSYLQTCWTPLPRHLLTDTNTLTTTLAESDFALLPVGYGPYMIERREQGGIRMRRNPYHDLDPLPQAEHLSLVFPASAEDLRRLVLAGSLDVAFADHIDPELFPVLDQDHEQGTLSVQYVPGPIWEHLDFNLDVALFQDIRVRRAIAYGTNRQAMVETFAGGHVPVLHSWIVPEHWAAAPPDTLTRYPYDPEQARQLLDEVGILDRDGDGWRERPDTNPLTITLLTTSGSPLRAGLSRRFVEDMAAIGLAAQVQERSILDLYRPDGPLFRRQFELAQFAWIATPDPGGMALWSCKAVPNETNGWSGNNFPGWCFREADLAIRRAATSRDAAERQEAYRTQQQLFTQEIPSLPLFQRPALVLSRPSIHHLRPDPIAPSPGT